MCIHRKTQERFDGSKKLWYEKVVPFLNVILGPPLCIRSQAEFYILVFEPVSGRFDSRYRTTI